MKKAMLATFILILLAVASLPAQNDGANEAYIKAMTTNDVAQRVKLLKEYIAQYGGKGTQYENYALATLCTTPYTGKTPKEAIDYGEKALALGGLDEPTLCGVYLEVSGNCTQLGQSLEKAKNYALQSIKIAEANKNNKESTVTPDQWNRLIGAGYYFHAQALEKTNNSQQAVDSYIRAYDILKSKQIAINLAKIGKSLYDSKSYLEAEKALKIATSVSKDYGSIVLYAKTLHRNGKKEEALSHYKQAYSKQKSGEIAYNIGIILAGKVKSAPSVSDEAMKYLLEASFLSEANSKKAMSLAESLFFNTHKENAYNKIVQELADRGKKLEGLSNSFNEKFGEKEEEDLTEAEKKEMKTLLANIEAEKKAVVKLEEEQKTYLEQFNSLIEQTKQRLGIK